LLCEVHTTKPSGSGDPFGTCSAHSRTAPMRGRGPSPSRTRNNQPPSLPEQNQSRSGFDAFLRATIWHISSTSLSLNLDKDLIRDLAWQTHTTDSRVSGSRRFPTAMIGSCTLATARLPNRVRGRGQGKRRDLMLRRGRRGRARWRRKHAKTSSALLGCRLPSIAASNEQSSSPPHWPCSTMVPAILKHKVSVLATRKDKSTTTPTR